MAVHAAAAVTSAAAAAAANPKQRRKPRRLRKLLRFLLILAAVSVPLAWLQLRQGAQLLPLARDPGSSGGGGSLLASAAAATEELKSPRNSRASLGPDSSRLHAAPMNASVTAGSVRVEGGERGTASEGGAASGRGNSGDEEGRSLREGGRSEDAEEGEGVRGLGLEPKGSQPRGAEARQLLGGEVREDEVWEGEAGDREAGGGESGEGEAVGGAGGGEAGEGEAEGGDAGEEDVVVRGAGTNSFGEVNPTITSRHQVHDSQIEQVTVRTEFSAAAVAAASTAVMTEATAGAKAGDAHRDFANPASLKKERQASSKHSGFQKPSWKLKQHGLNSLQRHAGRAEQWRTDGQLAKLNSEAEEGRQLDDDKDGKEDDDRGGGAERLQQNKPVGPSKRGMRGIGGSGRQRGEQITTTREEAGGDDVEIGARSNSRVFEHLVHKGGADLRISNGDWKWKGKRGKKRRRQAEPVEEDGKRTNSNESGKSTESTRAEQVVMTAVVDEPEGGEDPQSKADFKEWLRKREKRRERRRIAMGEDPIYCDKTTREFKRRFMESQRDVEFMEEVLANVSRPHPLLSAYPSAVVRFPKPTGICIAIPAVPRNASSRENSMAILRLLQQLSSRRAHGFPLLSHAVQAVVYSGHCIDGGNDGGPSVKKGRGGDEDGGKGSREEETKGERSGNEAQASLSEQEDRLKMQVAKEMNEELRSLARNLTFPTQVLTSHGSICKLYEDLERVILPMGNGSCYPNHKKDRLVWRTKEALDFLYVVQQCAHTNPEYVLFLQDDVEPAYLWDLGIEYFFEEKLDGKKPWPYVALYVPQSYGWGHKHGAKYDHPCCDQGLLFNASFLPNILEYTKENFAEKPVDYILRDFMAENNLTSYAHVPSLFQHAGTTTTRTTTDVKKEVFHNDAYFDRFSVVRAYEARKTLSSQDAHAKTNG